MVETKETMIYMLLYNVIVTISIWQAWNFLDFWRADLFGVDSDLGVTVETLVYHNLITYLNIKCSELC